MTCQVIALNGREAPEVRYDGQVEWRHNVFTVELWRNAIDVTHARHTVDAHRLGELHATLNIPFPTWLVLAYYRMKSWTR